MKDMLVIIVDVFVFALVLIAIGVLIEAVIGRLSDAIRGRDRLGRIER